MYDVGVSATALVLVPSDELRPIRRLVLDSVSSIHSRRAYSKALDDFFEWYRAEPRGALCKAIVQQYRSELESTGLASSTINVRLAAVKKLASEASDNGMLSLEAVAGIAKVRGAKRRGVRTGNWLDREQAQQLLAAPDARTVKGKRDRAILALLIGCGLRRAEIVSLRVDHVQQRDGRWVLADIVGKGNRVRTVPVPSWVKVAIEAWVEAGVIREGRLFRAIHKGGQVWGDSLSEKVIWSTIQAYAAEIGVPKLAPHDLRRTCAKLCRSAGGDLEQIQFLLGHASIQTTERYLGSRQNLTHAVNDDLGLEF